MAAEPSYDFTWLESHRSTQHAVAVIEEYEVGWYQGVHKHSASHRPTCTRSQNTSRTRSRTRGSPAILIGGALARTGLEALARAAATSSTWPDATLSSRNVSSFVSGFYDLVDPRAKDGRSTFRLAGTFCHILVGNVMGLVSASSRRRAASRRTSRCR